MWTTRRARITDLDTICANNAAMAVETENKTLNPDALRAGCRAVLEDPSRGTYYLAEDDSGQAVGQLMLTYEWSDWRNGFFWWIQSVYVAATHRRRGVYRALYETVHQAALLSDNVCGLRLYVYRSNEGAQATYRALGMTAYGYEVYEVEL